MMKYEKVKDGQLVQPVMRGYKMRCCDCGLVHMMNFKIVGGQVQFTATRDNRATAAIRRHYETMRVIKGKGASPVKQGSPR